MKKLILGIAVAVAGLQLSALADGEILYWQVPTGSAAETVGNYSYATLYANVTGGGEVSLLGDTGATFVKDEMDLGMAAYDLSQLGSTSVASFFVEYFNDQHEQVGYSDPATLSYLAQYMSNKNSNPPVPQAGPWQPTFTAVPEPTSGLLMLLGIAGLALRRKKA